MVVLFVVAGLASMMAPWVVLAKNVAGGPGDDTIDLGDGLPDQLTCGPGSDTPVYGSGLDTAAPAGTDPDTANCETFNL